MVRHRRKHGAGADNTGLDGAGSEINVNMSGSEDENTQDGEAFLQNF